MADRRGSTTRSIGLLVAGMLTMGAFALAPATAHIGSTKGHLQKHLDKRYVQRSTLMTWGPVTMSISEGPRLLTKKGPLSWFANCEQTYGSDNSIHAFVTIATSKAGGFVQTFSPFSTDPRDQEQDFGPEDNNNPVFWANVFGDNPTGNAYSEFFDAVVQMPGGPSIEGRTIIGTNFGGSHCYFSGELLTIDR